jgi:hypothetical protein
VRATCAASCILALLVSGAAHAQPEPKPKYPPVKLPGEPDTTEEPDPGDEGTEKPESEPEKKPAPPPPRPVRPPPRDDEAVMTDNTRPAWLALGFGPSVGIVGCVRRLCNTEQAYTQFEISEDFGYHVSGTDGFAVGANLQQAFNSDFARFSAAFRMWWDAPIADDLALYLTPMVHLGYALQYFDFGELGSIVDHAFDAQLGLAIRMVLLDRAMVYVRPVTANMNVGADGVALFYDIAVGGGFTFDL